MVKMIVGATVLAGAGAIGWVAGYVMGEESVWREVGLRNEVKSRRTLLPTGSDGTW